MRRTTFIIGLFLLGCSSSSDGANASDLDSGMPGVDGSTSGAGGASGVGGASSSGGTASLGGTSSSGGASSLGGASSSGATGAGGDPSAGGTSGAGGASSNGGAPDDGGVPDDGGAGAGGSTGAGGVPGAGGAGAGGRGAGGAGTGGAGAGGGSTGTGGYGSGPSPFATVYRIRVRVHTADTNLTNAQLGPILAEVNDIWLSQAGICFEFEVTDSNTNLTVGFDVRYTSGFINGDPDINGIYRGDHNIEVVDAPELYPAPHQAHYAPARTTAHELGHGLNLGHQNPPDDPVYTSCANPCWCRTLGLDCDEHLMRSHRWGYFLHDEEVSIARARAAQKDTGDTSPGSCVAPVFN